MKRKKLIPTFIQEVAIYEQYRKIGKNVYWYYSFDQGLTWDRKLTGYKQIHYQEKS